MLQSSLLLLVATGPRRKTLLAGMSRRRVESVSASGPPLRAAFELRVFSAERNKLSFGRTINTICDVEERKRKNEREKNRRSSQIGETGRDSSGYWAPGQVIWKLRFLSFFFFPLRGRQKREKEGETIKNDRMKEKLQNW